MATNLYPVTIGGKDYNLPPFNTMMLAPTEDGAIFIHFKNDIPVGVSVVDKDF